MVKMMVRSLVQWQYSAPCAHSLESTSLKIGESMKIGVSIGISTWKLPTVCFSKNLFMRGFMMDGNFQAKHIRMRNPENDVPLSEVGSREAAGIPISHVLAGICSRSDRDQHAMITVQ